MLRAAVPSLASAVTHASSQLSAASPTSAAVTGAVGYAVARCYQASD